MAEADIATIQAENINGINTLIIDASKVNINSGDLTVGGAITADSGVFNNSATIGSNWDATLNLGAYNIPGYHGYTRINSFLSVVSGLNHYYMDYYLNNSIAVRMESHPDSNKVLDVFGDATVNGSLNMKVNGAYTGYDIWRFETSVRDTNSYATEFNLITPDARFSNNKIFGFTYYGRWDTGGLPPSITAGNYCGINATTTITGTTIINGTLTLGSGTQNQTFFHYGSLYTGAFSAASVKVNPISSNLNGIGSIYFLGPDDYASRNRIDGFYASTDDYYYLQYYCAGGIVLTMKKRLNATPQSHFTGTIYAGSWNSASDDRLKHNEIDIVNGLNIIRQLNPQKYQKTSTMYEADYQGDISGDWNWESGLIAQDILKIPDLSYCVSGGDYIDSSGNLVEEKYYLNYNDIFVYGLAATKELDAKNTALEQKVLHLEQENLAMKAALNSLLTAAGQNTI